MCVPIEYTNLFILVVGSLYIYFIPLFILMNEELPFSPTQVILNIQIIIIESKTKSSARDDPTTHEVPILFSSFYNTLLLGCMIVAAANASWIMGTCTYILQQSVHNFLDFK